MTYTFYENIISDLHKDAYGFRPSQRFFDDWASYTDDEKQECWDYLIQEMNESMAEEARQEALALERFNQLLAKCMSYGAQSREDALRWMTQDTKFYNDQCVEHWVWNQGILFTDEGRALVKELMNIVKFEEYA